MNQNYFGNEHYTVNRYEDLDMLTNDVSNRSNIWQLSSCQNNYQNAISHSTLNNYEIRADQSEKNAFFPNCIKLR